MDEETDEDESNYEEMVKQQVRRHDEVLFHRDERSALYCIRLLLDYPLHSHTRPSARWMAVLWTFRELSWCRHVRRELLSNALLDVTLLKPATACH